MSDAAPAGVPTTDDQLIAVLKESVWPDQPDHKIRIALDYCRARNLDPLLKPIHFVRMRIREPQTNNYVYREVILPGIGVYRVQAARTGQHAGTSDPEFGPMQSMQVGDQTYEFPEWCRVVVRRVLANGLVGEFVGYEFWLENYATKNSDTKAPNTMWSKRARGQLAKCAEAQALRKGFPEVGQSPTFEEMEGREFFVLDGDQKPEAQDEPQFTVGRKVIAHAPSEQLPLDVTPTADKVPVATAADAPPAPQARSTKSTKADKKPEGQGDAYVSAGQVTYLKNKAAAQGVDLQQLLIDAGGLVLDKLTQEDFDDLKSRLQMVPA